MNYNLSFPIKEVGGKKWCSLANMGIKRVDIVAFKIHIQQQQYSFAAGHRHRLAIARDDVHLCFPTEDITVNIAAVRPTAGVPKRRHDKK